MYGVNYLIRLDDACPYMNREKWQRVEDLLDKYGIKPLVGIIPANADRETILELEDGKFWNKVEHWKKKGWVLALHGYDHVCTMKTGGMNPIHERSEFAGLPYEEQITKLMRGYTVLSEHGFDVNWFFAPSHTFDENTLKALLECTPIRYISDTIAIRPYRNLGFTFVPCQMGRLREMPLPGLWCACYHPNIMSEEEFDMLEVFLNRHSDAFASFDSISATDGKRWGDRIASSIYFAIRKIKK